MAEYVVGWIVLVILGGAALVWLWARWRDHEVEADADRRRILDAALGVTQARPAPPRAPGPHPKRVS